MPPAPAPPLLRALARKVEQVLTAVLSHPRRQYGHGGREGTTGRPRGSGRWGDDNPLRKYAPTISTTPPHVQMHAVRFLLQRDGFFCTWHLALAPVVIGAFVFIS